MKTIQEAEAEFYDDANYDFKHVKSNFVAGIEFAQRWILFSEEYPKPNDTVLVMWPFRNGIKTSQITCGFVNDDKELITDYKPSKKANPTHWRPIEYI